MTDCNWSPIRSGTKEGLCFLSFLVILNFSLRQKTLQLCFLTVDKRDEKKLTSRDWCISCETRLAPGFKTKGSSHPWQPFHCCTNDPRSGPAQRYHPQMLSTFWSPLERVCRAKPNAELMRCWFLGLSLSFCLVMSSSEHGPGIWTSCWFVAEVCQHQCLMDPIVINEDHERFFQSS